MIRTRGARSTCSPRCSAREKPWTSSSRSWPSRPRTMPLCAPRGRRPLARQRGGHRRRHLGVREGRRGSLAGPGQAAQAPEDEKSLFCFVLSCFVKKKKCKTFRGPFVYTLKNPQVHSKREIYVPAGLTSPSGTRWIDTISFFLLSDDCVDKRCDYVVL